MVDQTNLLDGYVRIYASARCFRKGAGHAREWPLNFILTIFVNKRNLRKMGHANIKQRLSERAVQFFLNDVRSTYIFLEDGPTAKPSKPPQVHNHMHLRLRKRTWRNYQVASFSWLYFCCCWEFWSIILLWWFCLNFRTSVSRSPTDHYVPSKRFGVITVFFFSTLTWN